MKRPPPPAEDPLAASTDRHRRRRPGRRAMMVGALAATFIAAAEDTALDPRMGVWAGALGDAPITVCIEAQGYGRYYAQRDRLPTALLPAGTSGGDYNLVDDTGTGEPWPSPGTWELGDPADDTLTGVMRGPDHEPTGAIHLRRLSPPLTPRTDPPLAGPGFCDTEAFTAGLYQPPRESVSEAFRFNNHRYRVRRVVSAYGTHPLRISRPELLDDATTGTHRNRTTPRPSPCCEQTPDDAAATARLNAVLLAALPTTVAALRDDLWTARLRLLDDWGEGSALEEWAEIRLWNRHWLSIVEDSEVRRGGETLARRVAYRTWALAGGALLDLRDWVEDPEQMAALLHSVRVRALQRAAAAGARDDCLRRLEANDYWQTGLAPDGLVFATAFTEPTDDCGAEIVIPYLDLAHLVSEDVQQALCTELGRVPDTTAGGCR
ncbi:hypothetical protein [uncultured Lamprocystis sp.]|uniref:hypothetical protein n=1 Tax=uncultured Lamprocystis sp. TaxID=543132 RepID=UPI0025EB0CAD|nr:hypothetical protein [uncultured Lamprocystis sp.]